MNVNSKKERQIKFYTKFCDVAIFFVVCSSNMIAFASLLIRVSSVQYALRIQRVRENSHQWCGKVPCNSLFLPAAKIRRATETSFPWHLYARAEYNSTVFCAREILCPHYGKLGMCIIMYTYTRSASRPHVRRSASLPARYIYIYVYMYMYMGSLCVQNVHKRDTKPSKTCFCVRKQMRVIGKYQFLVRFLCAKRFNRFSLLVIR